ncbi:hypothetical protein DXG01_006548 [Tephrocybe rancida]|nr:hypothetical protein DXG01_006548 [Tephrocybe rancida]
MDPDELDLLTGLGSSLLENFAPLPLAIFLYGIHVVLFSITTRSFLRRPRTVPARLIFIATAIGLLASANIAASIADYIKLIRSYLVTNIQLPPDDQEDLGDRGQFTSSIIGQWTSDLMPILSDIVVIWRCWVLFPERQWVMAFPIFFLLTSMASTFTFLGMVSTFEGYAAIIYKGGSKHQLYRLYSTGIALSCATNLVATALIGYKLWTYGRFITVNNETKKQTPVSNILSILVESGVVFCCLQVGFLIVDTVPQVQVPEAGYIIDSIYSMGYTTLAAMYPTIVVVLVDSQRSIVDFYQSSVASDVFTTLPHHATTTVTLDFAVPPSQSHGTALTGSVLMGNLAAGENFDEVKRDVAFEGP